MSVIGKRIIVTDADYEDIAINSPIHTYTITTNVENGTYQGSEIIEEGTEANIIIIPNTNYYLPDTITVVGAEYIYNKETGVIRLSNPTGNITITIVCITLETYTITANITNGSSTGDTSIVENGTALVTIAPDTDYTLPNAINVTGATYSYDKITGIIVLSNPIDNVAITVVCTDTEPLPILVQGYWSSNGDILPNRVCNETLIKGIQTITTKPGYVIRAVYAYTQEFTFPQKSNNILIPYYALGGMVAETSETRTSYTTPDDRYYYGVTFAKTNATANILPSENIIASWVKE